VKLFKWQRGRQANCRYWKYPLWFFRVWKFGFDGYILAYPKGAVLPSHRDTIDGKIWRLNITLSGISIFGIERSHWLPTYSARKVNMFRPDLYMHSLVAKTRTYKLSLGFAIFNKT